MAKTLGALITIAGAIVVNVVPGLGQIASAAILIGSAVAGSLVASLGAKSPRPDTSETTLRTPLAPRVDAFGELRLYPALVCYETAPDGSTVDVGVFAEGPIAAVTGAYLNDDVVTVANGVVQTLPDKSYQGGNVRMGWNLGAPAETAFAPVVAAIPDRWTTSHRGDGVVSGYLIKAPEKDKRYLETYPQGDNVQMSLVGQWKRVFDWRDGAQRWDDPSTWRYSDNPVLGLVWYLMVRRSVDWSTRIAPQLDRLTAAANDCEAPVPLKAGGTEARYRCALAYKLTDSPANIVAAFLATFDGWYDTNEAGEVVIYAGRYYPPTVSLGPDQITAFTVPYGIAVEDAVNEITVQYVSKQHDYKTVDAQAWRDETAITLSGREPNTTDLGAQIPSFSQGRRLAKRKMARARRAPITISTTMAGEVVIGERFVSVDLAEAGATFYRGPVEIVTAPERDNQTGGVTFQCIPVDPAIDAWNPATEEGEGAPVANRVAPEPVDTPVITGVTVQRSNVGASDDPLAGPTDSSGARLLVAVAAPDRPDLTWYARFRVGTGAWTEQAYADEDPGASVSLLTGFVPLAQRVQVEAAYSLGDGRLSDWSAAVEVDTRPA